MDIEKIRIIIIITLYFINGILLYNRKKKWVKNKYKWLILILLSLIGVFSLYETKNYIGNYTDQRLIQWAFMTPLVFSVIDYALLKASFLLHNRDLYLWLRGSSEIDDRKFSGGKHVKVSDRLFSIFLLITLLILPFFVLFFTEDNK